MGRKTPPFGILRPLGLLLLGLAFSPAGAAEAGPAGPDEDQPVRQTTLEQDIASLTLIRSCAMNVHYQVSMPAGQRPARVELWYCRQRGGTWQLYDYDEDCVSPIRFVAPGEGIFQFLVVAVDRLGRRSVKVPGPASGDNGSPDPDRPAPQQEIFVDYTTPRLILQYPRQDIPDFRRKQLVIRWAGFDAHLAAAPVRLYYRPVDGGRWIMLDQPQPACGSYTWQIPPQLGGTIQIRVQIMDLAGNEESQSSGIIVLAGDYAPAGSSETYGVRSPPPVSKGTPSSTEEDIEAAAISGLAESDRFALARQLFQRGNLYSQRLEWQQAAEAFGKAVMYDPDNVSARVNLANALFRQGHFQQAQVEYQRSLQLKPSQSSALFGLAQTQIALKQYAPAQQTLTRLLEQDRRDWQAWLMHGNVAAQLGQEQVALTSWQRAANERSPVRRLAMEKLEQTQRPYSQED
ncbi:MAG: tetratricopeptide repeat protein [Sedimentisphaerales bacterium]|nr:tetratricopeptide repeat protein [Sedimentisphaerales bacterium]